MNNRRPWALLSILVLICSLTLAATSYLERASFFFYDFLQRNSQVVHDGEVQLILLDQQSIDQMSLSDGINYPWPREYYGVVNLMAKEFGAKALFFDFLFTETSTYGLSDDQRFSLMIKESGIATFLPAGAKDGSVKPPVAVLADRAAGVGAVHFKSSADGVYRRVPRVLEDELEENKGEPGVGTMSISYLLALHLGVHDLPKDNAIAFYQNQLSATPFYLLLQAYHQLQLVDSDRDHLLIESLRKKLKNRIWMVGATAPGLMDLRPTSVSSTSPGVAVHATSLLNLVRHEGVRICSALYYLALGLLSLILLAFSVFQFKRPLGAILCSFSFSTLFPLFLSGILFIKYQLWLNPLVLILSLLLQTIVLLGYRFNREWLAQMRISKSLEHTMSHEMLELVKLGGFDSLTNHQHRQVTVLFSDIADFTSISELLDPG